MSESPRSAISSSRLSAQVKGEVDTRQRRIAKLKLDADRAAHHLESELRKERDLERRHQSYLDEVADRQHRKETKYEQQAIIRQQVQATREKQNEALHEKQQRQASERRQLMEDARLTKQINQCLIEINRAESRERTKEQREEIRTLKSSLADRRRRMASRRADQVRTELAREIDRDEEERMKLHAEAARLKDEEEQLRARVEQLKRHLSTPRGSARDATEA